MLCDLPVAKAVALAPSLFGLCRQAQGAAAAAALRAAEGIAAEAEDAVVAAEAAQEHLWRLLIDWPHELGLPSQDGAFVHWRRQLLRDAGVLGGAQFLAYLEQEFFGAALASWLAIGERQVLRDWAEAGSAPAARLCAALLYAEEAFEHARDVEQSGALRRRSEDRLLAGMSAWPLLGHVLARMQELAAQAMRDESLPQPGTVLSQPLGPGRGRALVETARGTLTHDIEVAEGSVVSYTILSPTENNFREQGPLHALLLGREFASVEAAQIHARRCVLALDPCVVCSVIAV